MTRTPVPDAVAFEITTTPFDERYRPSATSRSTTNFANLARGEDREENLRAVLAMIDRRFDELTCGDAPPSDRHRVTLEIVSADLCFTADGEDVRFPLVEMLASRVHDRETGADVEGVVGHNLSSYLRDHDFSVLLPRHTASGAPGDVPDGFGELHGALFRRLLESEAYRSRFTTDPVICLSVSSSRTYTRGTHRHPVLGVEYHQDAPSRTDDYFARMGLSVRHFMPDGAVAPLSLYHSGDLEAQHTDVALTSLIATMETFQRIYRPEIYHATTPAGATFRPSLENPDHTVPPISYDRVERTDLAREQGRYAEEHLMTPHADLLRQWAAAAPSTDREDTR